MLDCGPVRVVSLSRWVFSAYINSTGVLPSANNLAHAYMYGWNVQSPCHIGHSAGSAESTYGVSTNYPRLGGGKKLSGLAAKDGIYSGIVPCPVSNPRERLWSTPLQSAPTGNDLPLAL